MALAVSACGSDTTVEPDEVLPALRSVPGVTYRWRRVARPPAFDAVVAGRARDRTGVTLDFAVAVQAPSGHVESLPIVPHGISGGTCAGYVFISDSGDTARLTRAQVDRKWTIANHIFAALDAKAPDAYCEG
jgi:hypothetical protein